MKNKGMKGFSYIEVLVSFIIGMILIEILMSTFICTKKIQIGETRQQETMKYGQEMMQYVWNEKNKGREITPGKLMDYLRERPEKMGHYTYSFMWVPFTQDEHVVGHEELVSAIKCSTEVDFDWSKVGEAINSECILLKTPKQKQGLNVGEELGVTYTQDNYWLIGSVSYKNGERGGGNAQYFVAYQ